MMERKQPRRHEVHEESVVCFDTLSKEIVDCCFQVHQKLGCGLLEDMYEEPLTIELRKKGLKFETQKQIPLFYDGQRLKKILRLDLIVEDKIILELKSVNKILPVHEAQLLTYLKVTNLNTGFLINFHEPYFKHAIKRFIL